MKFKVGDRIVLDTNGNFNPMALRRCYGHIRSIRDDGTLFVKWYMKETDRFYDVYRIDNTLVTLDRKYYRNIQLKELLG